jgi:HEAT repeats
MRKNKWIVMIFFLLFPAVGFPGPDQPDPSTDEESVIKIELKSDDTFALRADQAPLHRVIGRIRQYTETAINYESLPDVLTTVSCSGTVVELVRCVLGDNKNLMVRYGDETIETAGAVVPAEIWILGSHDGRMSEAEPLTTAQCEPKAVESANNPGLNIGGTTKSLTPHEREALFEQIRSQDWMSRKNAITRLSRIENDDEVLESVHQALDDEHPSVRAQALSVLAAHKAAGADQILRQALLDPDVDVRLMAVDSAGNDEALLIKATEDSDPNVRVLAKLKLEDLYNSSSDEER